MEVAPPVVQVIMNAAGQMHWDELTKHGKKYPGICRDDEHPYYVLVWEASRLAGSSVASAVGELHVLDNGCLVYPSVSGAYYIRDSEEKAIKKVFEDVLHFLAENGKQPAPSRAACVPPKWLGLTKYKLTNGDAAVPVQAGQSPAVGPAAVEDTLVVGTGFFVSEHGYILTNAHVVSGCKQIRTRDGRAADLVSKDEQIDLSLLKVNSESPAVASFRLRPTPRLGDSVIAFGFPLQGLLSSEGNLSTGTVAGTTGLADDPRFMQVSAPVQPGSSGSPLLDSGGDVIGVMEAKLDAMKTLRMVGDIPENINFAIRGSEAVQFLERNHIAYHAETADSTIDLKVADVAAKAKQFSLPIECVK
jgi:S1-C subfamily serine protease